MHNKIKNVDSIIFDLDGTLWNSKKIIADSWTDILRKRNLAKKEIREDELTSYMGKPIQEIGRSIFPDLNDKKRQEILDECCNYTNKCLSKKGAILYDYVEKMLIEANEKYDLFIVSNCNKGYIESFLDFYGYWKYFKDIECSGGTGFSKGENIKLIMKRNKIHNPIYVGDTQGDADAAKLANVSFVFAKYGYGNVKRCYYYIDNLNDLLDILE